MMKSSFLNIYCKILIAQAVFITAILLLITAIRFINYELYIEIVSFYNQYINREISISLVLEGK